MRYLQFICFLASVIGEFTQPNDEVDKCTNDLLDDWITHNPCPNLNEMITCLQKAIDDPTMRSRLPTLTFTLQYYQWLERDTPHCPLLEAKGSCVDNEIFLCIHEPLNNITQRCQKAPMRLTCLSKIPDSCSTADLRHQKESLEEDLKSCDFGELKEEMRNEQCREKVFASCMTELNSLSSDVPNHEYLEMKVYAAISCLDGLRCNDTFYIQNLRHRIISLEVSSFD